MYRPLTILALCVATTAAAQNTTQSIDSGMTKAQVVSQLGAPLTQRSDGAYTFLYYRNGCEKTCGMHDVVVLRNDAVVDAIFRSPARHYTGHSSSPAAIPPSAARGRHGGTLVVPKPDSTRARDSTRSTTPSDSTHRP